MLDINELKFDERDLFPQLYRTQKAKRCLPLHI